MGFVFEQDRVRGGYYWTPVRSEWQCLDLRGRIAAQSNQATRALPCTVSGAQTGEKKVKLVVVAVVVCSGAKFTWPAARLPFSSRIRPHSSTLAPAKFCSQIASLAICLLCSIQLPTCLVEFTMRVTCTAQS